MKNNEQKSKIATKSTKKVEYHIKTKMCEHMERRWAKEQLPSDWKTAIHKKKHMIDCSNYLEIALNDVVLVTLLGKKNGIFFGKSIWEMPLAIRKSILIIELSFMLKKIMMSFYEYQIHTCLLFVDFIDAYDLIYQRNLTNDLKESNVPAKYRNMLKLAHNNTKSKIQIYGRKSEEFEVTRVLKQENPLSSTLFNFVLEK